MDEGRLTRMNFSTLDLRRPFTVRWNRTKLSYRSGVMYQNAKLRPRIRPRIPRRVPQSLDGMPRDCAVNLDNLQTDSKGKFGSLITTLGAGKMQQVWSSRVFAVGF